MSLIDKLMSVDKGTFVKEETAKIKSKRLTKILGEETYIKVKGIQSDVFIDISSRLFNADGSRDLSKSMDTAALIAVEGVVEPNLKDKDLQAHFDAVTPKDLAKILFKGNELTSITEKIAELSGFENNDAVEEIKN